MQNAECFQLYRNEGFLVLLLILFLVVAQHFTGEAL